MNRIRLLRLGLSTLFSLTNWLIIYFLIVQVNFFKYLFIEMLLLLSAKIYLMTANKIFKINDTTGTDSDL